MSPPAISPRETVREGAAGGGPAPVVLVAEELRPLFDGPPAWPAGARTEYVAEGKRLPERRDVVALVPLLSRRIGVRELERLPSLRVVANYAVGYDNVDVEAARSRGVRVTNTPDVLTESTADLAWALLLAASRRLREGLEQAVSGAWRGWAPDHLLGAGLQGKTLGILGAGRIGTATARRAPAFGVEVAYWSRSRSPEIEESLGGERHGSLHALLGEAHFVSLHLPLTEATERLVDEAALGAMRPDAVLVNTARGGIVDHGALAAALEEGRLAAAGLDVYPEEPRIPDRLRELPNAFLLPHLGSATRETRRAMWELAAENVRRVLRGEAPATPVEPGAGGGSGAEGEVPRGS